MPCLNDNKNRMSSLSAQEVQEIREAFALFDLDGSGTISIAELKTAMGSLGFSTKNHMVHEMINRLEYDFYSTFAANSPPLSSQQGQERRYRFQRVYRAHVDLYTEKRLEGGHSPRV